MGSGSLTVFQKTGALLDDTPHSKVKPLTFC